MPEKSENGVFTITTEQKNFPSTLKKSAPKIVLWSDGEVLLLNIGYKQC